jgi:hypothetical protein
MEWKIENKNIIIYYNYYNLNIYYRLLSCSGIILCALLPLKPNSCCRTIQTVGNQKAELSKYSVTTNTLSVIAT